MRWIIKVKGLLLLRLAPGCVIFSRVQGPDITNKHYSQWLKTDLGGPYADLPVEVGTKEVLRYLKEAGPEFNGRFLNIHAPGWEDAPRSNRYDGKDAPW
jgi:hypothetical protein